jgi:hypothetical protein
MFTENVDASVADLDGGSEGFAEETTVETGGEPTIEEPSGPSYFDLDQYRDQITKVKINGAEVEVPLGEMANGYMRQADYTQKTQELAAQRKQIEWANSMREALANDPAATLRALAGHFNVDLGPQPDPYAQYEDPLEREVYQLRDTLTAEVEGLKRERAVEAAKIEVARTVDALAAQYGEGFDAAEVVQFALENGAPGSPLPLEVAARAVMFDRFQARQKAEAEAQSKAKAEAERAEAKRRAALAAGGHNAGTAGPADGQINSIRDAWLAAKAEI